VTTTSPELEVGVDGAVALLEIRREQAGNSASSEVLEGLMAFFASVPARDTLRAVVLTGAGERFFCSGGDVKRYAALRTPQDLEVAFGRARALMDCIENCPVPVIAAINGWCLGGGSELMLACDIRIASHHARIGFPYNRLSLIPGWHGTERLVRTVGDAWARYLLLVGEPVDAAQACAIGLVHEVSEEGARHRALELARTLATRAPRSSGAVKRVLASVRRDPPAVSRRIADDEFESLWFSDDHREAEAAFAQKRPPRFGEDR
jgi:enoyl-CoA hydratase